MTTETNVNDGVLTVRRLYEASQTDVFDAWIDAAKTTHWWGCENTFKVDSSVDANVGGTYRHNMHIKDVGEYAIQGKILAYDPPSLLEYEMPDEFSGTTMRIHVAFEAVSGGTLVTLTQSQLPEPMQDVVAAGWTASFERLARFLTGERRAA